MGLLYKFEHVKQSTVSGFRCNKCGDKHTSDDHIEMQEMFHWGTVGGYGSVWGDGARVEITLCQRCARKLLADYAVSENFDGDFHD